TAAAPPARNVPIPCLWPPCPDKHVADIHHEKNIHHADTLQEKGKGKGTRTLRVEDSVHHQQNERRALCPRYDYYRLAYAPSMPPRLSLPVSMACDDGCRFAATTYVYAFFDSYNDADIDYEAVMNLKRFVKAMIFRALVR
nr:hypothetical protein [Tanacetum cinerariifolium]